MKKILLLVLLLVIGVVFAGCDVTYDIQKNGTVLITIECDEDDVDDFGEGLGDDLEFDEGDLDTKEDLEDILEDILDEEDDFEGEVSVKSFKRDKNDDFTMVFEYIPTDDVEDAMDNNEPAIGSALDVLDYFAEEEYDDDFEDIYEDEFADDVDDEFYYIFDKEGDEMTDKEMEEYFDKANLSKLTAAYVYTGDDVDVYIPGKIEMIISPDDSVDIDDDGAINFDYYAIIIYRTGGGFLTTLLIIVLIAALGVGGYFAYTKLFAKKEDDIDVELDVDVE